MTTDKPSSPTSNIRVGLNDNQVVLITEVDGQDIRLLLSFTEAWELGQTLISVANQGEHDVAKTKE